MKVFIFDYILLSKKTLEYIDHIYCWLTNITRKNEIFENLFKILWQKNINLQKLFFPCNITNDLEDYKKNINYVYYSIL